MPWICCFIRNNTSAQLKHEKRDCKCVHTYTQHVTPCPLAHICTNFGWTHAPYLRVYSLFTDFLHGTNFICAHRRIKNFFFVVLCSVGNIFLVYFKTVESYTKLNTLTPTSTSFLRNFTLNSFLEKKFSVTKSLYWKQRKWDQQKFLLMIFCWNYVYFFASFAYWKL